LNENDLSLSYNKTDTNGSNSAASVLWFGAMCQPWTWKVVSKKRHRSATESENDVDVQQPWSSTGGRKYLLRLEDKHGVTHETFNSRVVCTVAIDHAGDELVVGSAPADAHAVISFVHHQLATMKHAWCKFRTRMKFTPLWQGTTTMDI
jgi:hypothetical protein